MASPQTTANSGQLRSRSVKLASIFQRHELKFLNLSLVIYLCLGVLTFELLGEFDQDVSSMVGSTDVGRPAARKESLVELRESSARRMWNITNRLNILYESNWTRLMLDELLAFERQLLDKLMEEAAQEQLAGEDSEQDEDKDKDRDRDKDRNKESEKKSSERKSKSRIKSLKKSLIHSLSTITTVGFSQRIPSSAGKLATVIYGLLGIPLLFCSVAKTGKQVAHSAVNGLLIVRHYCFSLPIHYLCCSCSLYAIFRCLLWCCCCCCCSYLCCCLANDEGKNKCCDSGRAPKLKLRKRRQARTYRGPQQGGATRSEQQQQTPFVIGATSEGANGAHFGQITPAQSQQQKSVRFMNSSKKCPPVRHSNKQQDEEDYDEDDFHYTQGVFFTSLTALSVYLLLGAYFYSTYESSSLIDALFVCYSMLSTSKFPGQSDQIYSDPRTLYEHLNATATATATASNKPLAVAESIESETIKWIYLLIGLNLISACGHFAQLWLSNKLRLERCPISPENKKAACNGQIVQSLAGSFQSPPDGFNQLADELQLAPNVGQIISPTDYNNQQLTIYQQQPPPIESQVDLSELFLVQNQDSPNDMQFVNNQQQLVGQTSDVSLTSDRSTDRGSLCHHHQLQHQAHQTPRPNSNEPSLYAHSVYNSNMAQHHRHPSQSHLYLPSASALNCSEQQQQLGDHFILPNGVDCDQAEEMNLMLKSCMNGDGSTAGKLRSSSSSTQLSHLSGPIQHHHHQLPSGASNSSSTMSRVRNSFDKQNGQDSSSNITMNDGSNTISSTTSSRTVKLPHMRSNQHIGFILAPEHQTSSSKQ